MNLSDFWGEPISSYSRYQAIADGVLVDVTSMAREAGFKYPTALTSAVWQGLVVPDEASRQLGQSEDGRLWDILMVLRAAVLRSDHGSEVHFRVLFLRGGDRHDEVPLKALCGPGDTAEPVMTILLPDED